MRKNKLSLSIFLAVILMLSCILQPLTVYASNEVAIANTFAETEDTEIEIDEAEDVEIIDTEEVEDSDNSDNNEDASVDNEEETDTEDSDNPDNNEDASVDNEEETDTEDSDNPDNNEEESVDNEGETDTEDSDNSENNEAEPVDNEEETDTTDILGDALYEEPLAANSSVNDAQSIALNMNINGTITKLYEDNGNWYKFTVSENGYVSLNFSHNYIDSSGTYWKAYLYDSNMNELASYDFAARTTTSAQGKMGLPAGTYYLLIYSNNTHGVGEPYTINVNYTASASWETELNDDYSIADAIDVNKEYNGNLRISKDVDWYKFTITKAGYISLNFTHDYIDSTSTYWKAYLYDSNISELASYNFVGKTTAYTQGNIGLPAGTYYLKITDNSYSDKDYKIKINYTSSSVWETEFNDDNSKATPINVNKQYNGNLRKSSDVDWYKFKVTDAGYISLNFTHDYIDSSSAYWKAYLYDSNIQELASYTFTGQATTSTKGNIGLPAGTYYLKITVAYSWEHSEADYKIKINHTASSVWETEFNDDNSKADTIKTGTKYYGSMRHSSDQDWFKFTLSSGGMQILNFNHDIVSSYGYYTLIIYDASMTKVNEYTYYRSTPVADQNLNLKKGTYYIQIKGSSCSDGDKYSLKVTPHTHSYKNVVTKATASKNGKIVKTCSCGATNGTTTIYYPKTISLSATSYTYNGNARKPSVTVKGSNGKTIASSNYTVTYASGRKNVGTYKVTIKFKGNYSGTVTKTFKINPKATSLSSLTAKSKGFTVKWKKQTTQVTGYQIQYSTSKSFSSKTTKTITKNSTTSATYTGLKPKTKYYVRIRTYKTVNGTKYYSSWSSVKTVTTKK